MTMTTSATFQRSNVPIHHPVQDKPYDPDEAVGILLTYKNSQGRRVALQFPRQAAAAAAHKHHRFYNHSAFGHEIKNEARRFRTGRITCPKGMAKLVMSYLKANPNIEQVEIDAMVSAREMASATTTTTTRPETEAGNHDNTRIPQQPRQLQTSGSFLETLPYGISMIQVDQVWEATSLPEAPPATKVGVCVVDTGYDLGHEDLPTEDVDGWNPPEHSDWFVDGDGHGTHCTGTIAALGGNGRGVVGIVGGVREKNPSSLSLYIGKGLADTTGFGSYSAIIEACNKCVDAGARVISLSLGGPYSPIFHAVTRKLYDDGILLVAAAGNEGTTAKQFPASFPDVISVGAIDANGIRGNFSHANDQVELMAPGVDIYSTLPGNSYGYLSGTSMATPHVAGVAALLWSHFPNCTNNQIRNVLLRTTLQRQEAVEAEEAVFCNDEYGFGTIQAKSAYDLLETQGCEAGGPVTAPLSAASVGGCAQDPTVTNSTSSNNNTNLPPICIEGVEKLLRIQITTDEFPSESGWILYNVRDEQVLSGGPFTTPSEEQPDVWACLPIAQERYVFSMFDSFGDGLCCDQGQGSFAVYYDGELMGSGGEFFSTTTVVFPEVLSVPLVPTISPLAATSVAPTTSVPTTATPTTVAPTTKAPTLRPTAPPATAVPSSFSASAPFFPTTATDSPSAIPSVPPTFFTADLAPPIFGANPSENDDDDDDDDDTPPEPPKSLPLPSTNNVPNCKVNQQKLFTLVLKTNSDPKETRWIVKDRRNVAHRIGGPYMTPSLLNHISICLPVSQEPYTFTIYDAGGNGLCCSSTTGNGGGADGAFAVYYNGTLVGSGDEFGSIVILSFPRNKKATTALPTSTPTTRPLAPTTGAPIATQPRSTSRPTTKPSTAAPVALKPFLPPPTIPVVNGICEEGSKLFVVQITTDANPRETQWLLTTTVDRVALLFGGSYTTTGRQLPDSSLCLLTSLQYTFTLYDSGSDGFRNGGGGYAIYWGGKRLGYGGAEVTNFESVVFSAKDLAASTSANKDKTPTTSSSSSSKSPTASPTSNGNPPPPAPVSCPADEKLFRLALKTDFYPEETRWTLRSAPPLLSPTIAAQIQKKSSNEPILVSRPYTAGSQRQEDVTACLPAKERYEFIIHDDFGDGFCCSEEAGEGWYELYYDQQLIQRGGNFTLLESVIFP